MSGVTVGRRGSAAGRLNVAGSVSYTFGGTTKPSMVDVYQAQFSGGSVVSGGILQEGPTVGGTADGAYTAAALYGTPASNALYSAQVTGANLNQYYAAAGVAIGFDSAGTNGLLFLLATLGNFMPTCQVWTKVASAWNLVYSDSTNSTNGLTSPVLKETITFDGTNYVYTPSLNGTPITAAKFTDTAGVLGTPGRYFGAGFRTLVSSGSQYKSNGITNLLAA